MTSTTRWAIATLILACASLATSQAAPVAAHAEASLSLRGRRTAALGECKIFTTPCSTPVTHVNNSCAAGSSCGQLAWCRTKCYHELQVDLAAAAVCGDSHCNGGETCRSCPGDCGQCPREAQKGIIRSCVDPLSYALSFDDGPTDVTAAVLDILKAKSAVASFFVIGVQLDGANTARRQMVQRAAAEGHYIGSHTYSHRSFNTLSLSDVRGEMVRMDEILRSTVCTRPRIMRPPFGDLPAGSVELLNDMGYSVVNWNLDTEDWKWANVDNSQIVGIVQDTMDATHPGSIIHVQHDVLQKSVDTVSLIIDLVRLKGYTLVSMEDCIYGTSGFTSCAPGLQLRGRSCVYNSTVLPTNATACAARDGGSSSGSSSGSGSGSGDGRGGGIVLFGVNFSDAIGSDFGAVMVLLAGITVTVFVCACLLCSVMRANQHQKHKVQDALADTAIRRREAREARLEARAQARAAARVHSHDSASVAPSTPSGDRAAVIVGTPERERSHSVASHSSRKSNSSRAASGTGKRGPGSGNFKKVRADYGLARRSSSSDDSSDGSDDGYDEQAMPRPTSGHSMHSQSQQMFNQHAAFQHQQAMQQSFHQAPPIHMQQPHPGMGMPGSFHHGVGGGMMVFQQQHLAGPQAVGFDSEDYINEHRGQ